MGLGLGIFLIVLGAILSFAVKTDVPGLDLVMVGYILMGSGILTLLLGLVMNTQRTRTSHREVIERHDDAPPRY